MKRRTTGLVTAGTLLITAAGLAMADATPEDAASYRSSIMKALGGHIGAASMIVRGLIDNDGQLVTHARGIADTTKELDHVFPEGSDVGDTEALPAIWQNPEEFAAAVKKSQDAADAFLAAAESGDAAAIGAGMRGLGGSCRGCHDDFRVAQD